MSQRQLQTQTHTSKMDLWKLGRIFNLEHIEPELLRQDVTTADLVDLVAP